MCSSSADERLTVVDERARGAAWPEDHRAASEIKFPALLSFPSETTPQLCSLYAVVHKDPADPNTLTVLLSNEAPTLP